MDWQEYFFRHVFLAASKSKDVSTWIGAVLVQDGIIISEGYNGFPRGVIDSDERLYDRPVRLAYTVHAEHNAILNCARRGVSTNGSVLYTNAFPCDGCMKAIIQAGIKKVICHKGAHEHFYGSAVHKNWNDTHTDAQVMAKEAGIEIEFWDGKLNIETLVGKEKVIV